MRQSQSGSVAMPVRLHHSQEGFHKRHPSRGESKVYHKIQSDVCPPLLAKGANCLDVHKGELFAQTQVGMYTSKNT